MHTMQEAVRQRILPLMAEKNYSISELARRSNLRQSTVNDIVKGKVKNPSMQAMLQIAKAFNLTLGEFTTHEVFLEIEDQPMKMKR